MKQINFTVVIVSLEQNVICHRDESAEGAIIGQDFLGEVIVINFYICVIFCFKCEVLWYNMLLDKVESA